MPTESKRIVVTGTSRGLGAAMVAGFIERGHIVAGCARSEAAIAQAAEKWGSPHRFDVVDVTDDGQVARWAGEVLGASDPPDLLINNAALINASAPLWDVPAEEFSQVVDVNIKGVANVIRHFLPAMIARGSGVVVNFSSGWGRSVAAEVAPYCATKWAVEGLTLALADELPPGMAAVPLNPGIIHTEMLDRCFGTSAADYPSPDRWAETAVPFILSIGARENGQPLTAPG